MKPSATTNPPPSDPNIGFSVNVKPYTLRGFQGPLVVHSFSDKVRREIRDKHAKKPKNAKAARDPETEWIAARYLNAAGHECLPIAAIKKSLIRAADQFDDLPKTHLRQAIFVSLPGDESAMLVPITDHGGRHLSGVMREDGVTLSMNTRGLAYRPAYHDWQIVVNVQYNPRLVSEQQLDALMDAAGFGVGICEGRPEKQSALGWGRFARVGGPFIS